MDDSPLEYKPKTVSFPQISEEMLASIALGLEDELIVASRHGLSIEQYQELAAQPWFQLQVQVKRSEYEKNGVTFKAKAAWMAGELLDQVYVTAASQDASLNQKHEVLKTLIKAAGLEPKEEKVKDAGPGFSISIDLGGGQSISLSNQQTITPVTLVDEVTSPVDAEVKEIKNA
jgi:hypothetical protein